LEGYVAGGADTRAAAGIPGSERVLRIMRQPPTVAALPLLVILIAPSSASLAQPDALPPLCYGDCTLGGTVQVSDLVLLVNIALGSAPPSACRGIMEQPGINDLMRAVSTSLSRCPVAISYQLTNASTILVSDGTTVPSPEPLAGQFTVTVSTDLPPNSLIGLTIKRVHFGAPSLAVREGNLTEILACSYPQPDVGYGCISANTINPPPATFISAFLSIENQLLELSGGGPFEGNPQPPPYDGSPPPPPFNNLTLCSGICDNIRHGLSPGYILTLFAAAE